MSDTYGYIGIETLLEFCRNNKNHCVTPDDFMRMNRVKIDERPHGECNQCRYYEGVHGVDGLAPCSFWGIGGVLASDYCSRFEKVVTENE